MNDLEDRLHVALLEAVPDLDPPPGLLGAATGRAVRRRRRRVAAGSALGVVAAAVAGVTLLRPAAEPPTARLEPLASSSAAPAATGGTARVSYSTECGPRAPSPPAGPCAQIALTYEPDGGREPERTLLTDRYYAGEPAPLPPDRADVRFSNGARRTVHAAPDGAGHWVFDVAVPDGATVTAVTIVDTAGGTLANLRIEPD